MSDSPLDPAPSTAANLQAFRRAANGLLLLGLLTSLAALALFGLGAWCITHPGGGGEWKGLSQFVGAILIGAGIAVLLPSAFMLTMQGFVRAGSRTAARICIVTEIVFALLPAVAVAGLAFTDSPSLEEIGLALLGLCLWIAPHWWLLATLRKARARETHVVEPA
ncbi:MAG TPA: hypothetical protein VGO11_25780 [Chthoniobacteraceae bacterium]|jgi:hypothetical protein|nr:hypothetical protein [Chthoniobacteraceae bacterium]